MKIGGKYAGAPKLEFQKSAKICNSGRGDRGNTDPSPRCLAVTSQLSLRLGLGLGLVYKAKAGPFFS